MNYYMITGASRGLGEALANALLEPGNTIICISRSRNERLIHRAAERKVDLSYETFDLNQVDEIESMVTRLLSNIDKTTIGSIALINNAGILAPIKPIERCTSGEIIKNTLVNLTAPMVLSAAFASFVSDLQVRKQIINLSSGAGKKPYHGWGNYCSAKAGIDMFTRCFGLEQSRNEYPVRIVSLSPGIIDTEMQQEIRMRSREDFQDLDRFISFKEEGKLQAPETVARCIIDLMRNDEIGNGEVIDIKQLL